MDDTRLGKINDRINEKSYFYYISVASRGKGYMYDHCTFEKELSKIKYIIKEAYLGMFGDMYKLRFLVFFSVFSCFVLNPDSVSGYLYISSWASVVLRVASSCTSGGRGYSKRQNMDRFDVAFYLQDEGDIVLCSVNAFNGMTIGNRRRYLPIKFVWNESGLFTDESPKFGRCGRGGL